MPSILAHSKRLPGKMDRYLLHKSNVTSRGVECAPALNTPESRNHCLASSSFVTSNKCDYDASDKTDDAVVSEENATMESRDITCLTRNVLSFHSACLDDRRLLCEENNNCSTCNCNIMDRRNQDAAGDDDASEYSSSLSTHSTRKHSSDQILRPSITLRTNHLQFSEWRIYLFLFVCLLCITLCTGGCAIGLKTAGMTFPRGDIIIEYGQPLQIYCILNQTYLDIHMPNKNSADLVFFRNRKQINSQYVSVINKTTILLNIEKPPPSEDMYYCQIKLDKEEEDREYEAVCLNKVVVGFRPQKPKNFSCTSYNWENLNCVWEPMQNYVYTKFTLMFRLAGRMGRKYFPCPKQPEESYPKPPPNTCTWDATTNPIYRQPYEHYTFMLNAENVLGNNSFSYKFHHYANVIPARPENLTVVNKTLDSVLLYWNVPFPLQNFPPGLEHKIMYENQWDPHKTWSIINITSEPHASRRFYNLTRLNYANSVYDVRVFIKSAVAKSNMWSKFSHVTFRTPSTLPSLPPRTNIGSFEITENSVNRDIYLYWQAIPEYRENGDDFKYQIIHAEESGRVIDDKIFKPSETTRTYAKFKGISFNSYRFQIVSRNEIGINEERAVIFVPSKYEMPHEPLAFTKIAFEGGLYELSWKPPIESKDITNYTIFWCDNERDRPYQCTGYLDWVYVSKNTTIYNMTVPDPDKVYQFAISANTAEGSSGMVWASCTVIHNKVVGKMKSVWINRIGSDFIEVGWKLDCSDRIGIVEGFNIYYCPILSPYNLNCKGPKLNKTIKADPHMIHGIVDNLMPYTTYMLAIAVLTKSGEGLHSDPLYNTTLEAAPSTSPLDVKITNVTNTTMFITWKPPRAMNGVLRYYEIYYNDHARKAEEKNHVQLNNLVPYRKYNISVVACTVACSKRSPVKIQYTHIGIPGKINVPNVRFMNSSKVLVTWEVPQEASGPLENMYFEIETSNGEIQNTSQQKIQLPIPDCKIVGRERQYKFRVRAVNIANDVHLKGPWSDSGEGNCYSDGPSSGIWIFIWVLGTVCCIAFLLCIACGFRKIWLKCQAMRDVEVKLPPGLAPDMKLLQKVNEQHIRQSSADSSGCSSGQESVTSSLTAESQVSSDSGTEVDPVPISPGKLLEDTSPSWEANKRLRQRNISITQESDIVKTSSHCWNSYVKMTKSGEPILGETASLARSTPNLTDNTGYTTSPHTWSSTGYISMPSSEELSSNPSPVPRENANTSNIGGRYCVIGTKPEDDNGISVISDSNDEANDALIPTKREMTSVTNPYVSVASLEQKQKEKEKENQQSAMSNFHDLNEQLNSFVDTGNKFNLNTLAPHFTVSDKTTTRQEPYVQTGLMETYKPLASNLVEQSAKNDVPVCGSFASTSLTDSCNKSFVSPLTSITASSSLPDTSVNTSMKPSIAVSQIAELPQPSTYIAENKESLSQKKLHSSSHVPASSEDSSTSYVFASPVYQMLQRQHQYKRQKQQNQEQQQQQKEPLASVTEERKDDKDETLCPALSCQTGGMESGREAAIRLNSAKMPIITRQKSGYVTIVENPDAASSTTAQSDEQYSKMTVVPSTVQ